MTSGAVVICVQRAARAKVCTNAHTACSLPVVHGPGKGGNLPAHTQGCGAPACTHLGCRAPASGGWQQTRGPAWRACALRAAAGRASATAACVQMHAQGWEGSSVLCAPHVCWANGSHRPCNNCVASAARTALPGRQAHTPAACQGGGLPGCCCVCSRYKASDTAWPACLLLGRPVGGAAGRLPGCTQLGTHSARC